MKNFRSLSILLPASMLLLASCGGAAASDPYEKINAAIETAYSTFSIQVKSNTAGLELHSSYVFTAKGETTYEVAFTEESFNTIAMNESLPDMKKVETGTKTVSASEAGFSAFKVSESVYEEITYAEEGTFRGKAKDGKAMLNVEYTVTNLEVAIAFGEKLNSIALNYSANGATYEVTYSGFGK